MGHKKEIWRGNNNNIERLQQFRLLTQKTHGKYCNFPNVSMARFGTSQINK